TVPEYLKVWISIRRGGRGYDPTRPWSRGYRYRRLAWFGWSAPALGGYPSGQGQLVAEHLVQGPGMIGEPGRHRGRALLPLAAGAQGREPGETVVRPAEVVGAADQIHPRGQRVGLVGEGAAPSHQRRERTPKGRVETLDVRGVDVVAGACRRQHRRDRRRGPLD